MSFDRPQSGRQEREAMLLRLPLTPPAQKPTPSLWAEALLGPPSEAALDLAAGSVGGKGRWKRPLSAQFSLPGQY